VRGPLSFGANAVPIGLDIGTDHVRAAQVKVTGNGFQLETYGLVGLPMGSVVEGEIVDVDAVAMAVRELWKRLDFKGNSKNVSIGVANQKVVVRLIDLPYMNATELQSAIQYQAQDYVPIPVADAVLDSHIIGDYMTPQDEHMMEVVLIAAQRDMIGTAVQVIEKAGLKLQRVDVTSFAIVRALMRPSLSVLPVAEEITEDAVAVVHISSGITNIAVVERGIPRFTRVSSLAGNEFTKAISNVLNVTFDEAEEIKYRVGLPDAAAGTSAELSDADRIAQETLEREVNKFIAELRRSLDYYLTQTTQVRTIRHIMLTGSGARLTNLPLYLERGLQAEVKLADPLSWLTVAPRAAELVTADRLGSAAAIGLAVEGLLP
jgi:type IV pilus assembly protein PilM